MEMRLAEGGGPLLSLETPCFQQIPARGGCRTGTGAESLNLSNLLPKTDQIGPNRGRRAS